MATCTMASTSGFCAYTCGSMRLYTRGDMHDGKYPNIHMGICTTASSTCTETCMKAIASGYFTYTRGDMHDGKRLWLLSIDSFLYIISSMYSISADI